MNRPVRARARELAALALGATLAVSVLLGSRPGTQAQAAARPAGPVPGFSRVVFLSHVNDPASTPLFPGDPEFLFETPFTVPKDGFFLHYVH
jgi:hypothetical protein